MNNNSGGGRFFDGFLWGLIIGGGLVFLLGTKKGKKLVKMISEGGVENIPEFLEEEIDQEEQEEEKKEMVSSGNGISISSKPELNSERQNPEESKRSPSLFRRRFFRRKA